MKFSFKYLLLPSFCAKEPLPPTPNTSENPVTDRIKCTVNVTVNSGSVNVCGTNTTLAACGVAFGEQLFGNAVQHFGSSVNYGIETAMGPSTEGYLILTALPGPMTTNVTVTSGGVGLNLNLIPGVPQIVTISSLNCTPS